MAFMCDVEGMFRQVHVEQEHQNFLRFLWWEDGDLDKQPAEYRTKVHLFSAVLSPGCANFALKREPDNFEETHRCEAQFVRNDFYADDSLKSVPSVSQATTLIHNMTKLCAHRGFNLHKSLSKEREVIQAITKDQWAKGIKVSCQREFDMTKDLLPVETALGVQWFVQSHHLQFRIELMD